MVKYFSNTPNLDYEPLIRLFYANLYSMCTSKHDTLIMSKHIFIDCAMHDALFDIYLLGFSTSSKIPHPSNFDVLFEEAKRLCS